MPAALRPYVTAGIALVGASVIAVTPVTPSLPSLPVEHTATRLLADSSILNIPLNLAIAIANIPYYESLALQEYAYALGPAGQPGGVPGWIPPGATIENGGVDPGADGIPHTADDVYALGGTGSWWTESTDGNTWGWDNGNWPQLAAIGTAIFPFELALPIAQQLQTFAQAEFIAGQRVNCEFECADVLGYLGGWLMFQTPLTELLSGTNFPDTVNALDPVTGLPTIKPVWADQPGAQLDPLGLAQVFADYLMQDPSDNPIMLPDLGGVLANSVKLGIDFLNDYNPLVTGSFLYWGAPTLWSVPALLAGLVQNFTGIPNQFIGIGEWQGNADTGGGGIPPWGATAGPANLIAGVPAGLLYLAQGLLGYLNPNTYLSASMGNTLLRTYAAGSLPGSGIAELLTGLDPASVLSLGNNLLGAGSAESPARGAASLLGGPLDSLRNVGLPGSPSPTEGDTSAITSAENTRTPTNERLVTLDVAPGADVARGKHAAPDSSLAAPVPELPDQASDTAKAVTDAVNTFPPGPARGDAVVAATPANEASGGTTVVRDSVKFEPPTGSESGATSGGSDGPGAPKSSVAEGFGEAVKSALGGASKDDTGQ